MDFACNVRDDAGMVFMVLQAVWGAVVADLFVRRSAERALLSCGSPQHRRRLIRFPLDRLSRPRDYLTEREVERLMDASRDNRWGHRDATAILLAYRHGLRASELVALRWDDINLQ
jgi:integrase